VVGAVALLVAMPLWVIVAAFVSRFVPGRWRILRVAWFLFVYVWWEAIALVALFGTWIASGFGRRLRSATWQRRHYAFAAWWLARVMGSARTTFRLRIDRATEHQVERSPNPILVFSRHAGPGDSFLLVDGLLNGARRRPRIVLKDTLQFDPTVDVLLNRLPARFVPSRGRGGELVVGSIAELAAGMDADDALVLFPEGGNFTPGRHERAIARLAEVGRPDLSERAGRMRNLLPPKPLGALTAIAAAPHADVVFVGHVGLEQLSTLRDLWRGIPLDASVRTRLWRIAAGEIPPPAEREAWLYDQWELIDDWIGEQVTAGEVGAIPERHPGGDGT
jgi:1-acyl-sn-glycerol-3-phosphate acyltransferase